ncbi:MAG: hypothetical protein RIF32_06015, partial [Leptospirales bacterium]
MTLALFSAILVGGFAVLAARFKARGARFSFVAFCLALIVYLFGGHLVESGGATETVFRVLYFAANPAVVALAVFIGSLDGAVMRRPWFWIMPAVAVIVGGLILSTDFIIAGIEQGRPVFGAGALLFLVAIGGNLVASFATLRIARRRSEGLIRFQLTGTLIALAVAAPLTIGANIIGPLVFGTDALSAYGSPIAALLWVAILAYTVLMAQYRAAQADPRRQFVKLPAAHYHGLLETCRKYQIENSRLEAEVGRLSAEALEFNEDSKRAAVDEAGIFLKELGREQPVLRALLAERVERKAVVAQALVILTELIDRGVSPEEVLRSLR